MQKQELDIRYTRLMDVAYLKKWLFEPVVLEHFSMSNEAEIDTVVNYWSSFTQYQSSLTATIDHVPCAVATLFLMPYKKVAHHCSFKICVDPSRWRQGIGQSLIKNILHLAKNYFRLEAVHVEVFGNNPLIFLLKKMGFKQFMKQENYVKINNSYLPRTCFIIDLKEWGH